MFGLTNAELLGLSAFAAVIAVAGNLLALVLRELVLARSYDRWKERRSLRAVYQQYRDPIALSGLELLSRTQEIARVYPPDFLRSDVLNQHPGRLATVGSDDPYFRRYKLVSSAYRLCAFLGWLELYRQDVTFLDTGRRRGNAALDALLSKLRAALADGHLNQAADWQDWTDRLIFREEQRAIGAAMIRDIGSRRMVMGYEEFRTFFDEPDDHPWWLHTATSFLLDLEQTKDFRQERLRLLEQHLGGLIAVLNPSARRR
ncbi:hypothetical protein [Kribbella sp. C-35]|uniref:hypothetical protein n=1 Tax=Kribbella sp. C-35 TaxID=2789276 RepID=UPI00397C4C40